jgi:hypothetical protein
MGEAKQSQDHKTGLGGKQGCCKWCWGQAEYLVEKALSKEDLTVYLQASEWKTAHILRVILSVEERLPRESLPKCPQEMSRLQLPLVSPRPFPSVLRERLSNATRQNPTNSLGRTAKLNTTKHEKGNKGATNGGVRNAKSSFSPRDR